MITISDSTSTTADLIRRSRMRRKAGKDLAKLGYRPRTYGAARVSTADQNIENQPEVITELCIEQDWDLREIFRWEGQASEFRQKDRAMLETCGSAGEGVPSR